MEKTIDDIFGVLANKQSNLFVFVSIFTAIYGGIAAPPLPQVFQELFTQEWFRVSVLSLIAYGTTKDPKAAIMAAVLFMLVMNNL